MTNFLLGFMTTLGILVLAVGATLGVWIVSGGVPWDEDSGVQSDPELLAVGVPSPIPSVFASMGAEEKQRECDAIEWFFSEEGFGATETVLGRLADPVEWTSRWLPAARECFSESKVHRLVRVPAEFWLTSQSNLPAELHPKLLEPTMSWLGGETPVERTDALSEIEAIVGVYYASHPTTQIVFAVPSAPAQVPLGVKLDLFDLRREIDRLDLEFDVQGLR